MYVCAYATICCYSNATLQQNSNQSNQSKKVQYWTNHFACGLEPVATKTGIQLKDSLHTDNNVTKKLKIVEDGNILPQRK